ncbi:MAG: hypothetical protein IPL32_03915 [Chloracidobacterium sp.]|nr:hypothetical protein [Chloracidobacterium sp.]
MIGGILLLAIVVFGLQILFGHGKPENFVKLLIWLVFAPILISIGYNHLLWLWSGLPFWAQLLSLALIPFILVAILKMAFPKAAWLNGLLSILYDTLVFAVTFPFRFVFRAVGFIFRRERQRTPLERYRPVVGGRPPIQNLRQEGGRRDR